MRRLAVGLVGSDAIATSLGETNFGIVCVTGANQHAPWLIFEAGALAKSVELARVVPLRIDLSSSEVTGPLSAFQGRSLDEDGVRRLVQDLNEAAEKRMPKDRLDVLFKNMWPDLKAAIDEAINAVPTDTEPRRSAEDMLEEVVELTRRIDRQLNKEAGVDDIVFTKEFVKFGLGSITTYARGTSGLVTRVHTGPDSEITHVDVRLPNGEVVREVPIDYFRA
jgi:hypothetical protein